jgi:3-polyprenyl-4-hydroxybenzoate decarboxylase
MTTVPDLRSFLDEIRREAPGQLLTITEEVPLDYTSTALTLELERRGGDSPRCRVTTCAWLPICLPPGK